MSNAMYYAMRFGQPSVLLKDRLGVVPPRKMPVESAPPPDTTQEAGRSDDS